MLVAVADQALYGAKERGRDCVVTGRGGSACLAGEEDDRDDRRRLAKPLGIRQPALATESNVALAAQKWLAASLFFGRISKSLIHH